MRPPVLRPSAAASLVRLAATKHTTTTTAAAISSSSAPAASMTAGRVRSLSSTAPRRSGAGHGPQYDPPTGWLFGVKPGEKAEREGWEYVMYYGFLGGLGVFAVAYAFKPDTS